MIRIYRDVVTCSDSKMWDEYYLILFGRFRFKLFSKLFFGKTTKGV